MIKKIIAREWLYFLGFVVAALVVLPLPLMLIFDPQQGGFGFYKFYKALFEGVWIAWLYVIAPCLVFQLVRSVL
jgi:hypothetical protein